MKKQILILLTFCSVIAPKMEALKMAYKYELVPVKRVRPVVIKQIRPVIVRHVLARAIIRDPRRLILVRRLVRKQKPGIGLRVIL